MLKILIAEDDRKLRHLPSVGNIPCVGDYRQNAFDDMRMDFRIGVDDDMIKPIDEIRIHCVSIFAVFFEA